MVIHALFYIVSFFKQILVIDTLSISCEFVPCVMATGSLMVITAISNFEFNLNIDSGIAYGNLLIAT